MQQRTVQILSVTFFAALLAWGLYTLLWYLGMPIHAAVLLTGAAQQSVQMVCGTGQGVLPTLCAGAVSFVPFILHTFGRAMPLLWYVGVSLFAYVAWTMLRFVIDSEWTLRVTWKPWKIVAIFAACVWLMFTALANGTENGNPIRRFVEPTSETYNVSAEGLSVLRADYQKLLDRGCLAEEGVSSLGSRIYTLSNGCIQVSFVTRVLPQMLGVLVLLFELLVLGSLILQLLRWRPERMGVDLVLSVALGACAWIVLLWSAAVAGIFVQPVGWGLLVIVPVIAWKHVLLWGRKFLSHEWHGEYRPGSIALLLGWLLLSYLAINFLTVVRPFPIGWDDLGSYLNRPRLLVSYGHFIFSMSPFDWSYITSLGFLLFGYDSIYGATTSMMINWTAGLLAVAIVYAFVNAYLGKGRGMLAALLYYSLPMVGHFSFADMKIDNAVFFMGTAAVLTMFLYLFPPDEADEEKPAASTDPAAVADVAHDRKRQWQLLLLSGVFCGFAFAIKTTAVMVVVPVAALLIGVSLHWLGFAGAAVLAGVPFTLFGGLSVLSIASRVSGGGQVPPWTVQAFEGACLVIGGVLLALAVWKNRAGAVPTLKRLGIFLAGFLVAVMPWIIHNNIRAGNVVPKFLLGAPNNLSPTILMRDTDTVQDNGQDIRRLPPELKIDPNSPACQASGSKEELDRYWGFSGGWGHYLTLPWRMVMNVDAVGYYVTTVFALLLFPLTLLLPYAWTKRGRWLRWLTAATALMIVEWVFLANGIPWYGIGMFLGLTVALEAMVAKAPDSPSRWTVSAFIVLALLCNFSMRLWQFESQRNILEYGFGKISAATLEELTIPHYNGIRQEALARAEENPANPYLYRVGTFIPYFIPRNLEIIGLNDHQLDVFNCLYQERDAALTLKRFKALGFNAIIFDTNTATIEQDPNGSLHQKVNQFLTFVNNRDIGLQVLLNDPGAGVAFVAFP